MSKLPVIISQYELLAHPRRTEHWALAVITDIVLGSARVFQLIGGMDSFCFESADFTIDADNKYCGGVQVGEVAASDIPNLEKWLRAVPIHRHRTDWDCQDWVIDAVRALSMDNRGIVFANTTERSIRAELEEEKERWQTGQDLLHERLR
ncbi:hypothetical protein BDZ89DRAFT_1012028 [Hymenopellis radicata]|nr:hypothetical protein BDZ89DRAFT_1012028 [Hymenopellis radicata]